MLFYLFYFITLAFAFSGIVYLLFFRLKFQHRSDQKITAVINIVLLCSFMGMIIGITTFNERSVPLLLILYGATIWFVAFRFILLKQSVVAEENKRKNNITSIIENFPMGVVVTNVSDEVVAVNDLARSAMMSSQDSAFDKIKLFLGLDNNDKNANAGREKTFAPSHHFDKYEIRDSQSIHVETHSVVWEDHKYMMLMLQDISAEQKLSFNLTWSMEYNKMLIQSAPVFLVLINESGNVEFISDYGKKMLGLSKTENLANFNEFIPKELLVEASKLSANSSPDDMHFSTPIVGKDGRQHFINWRSAAVKNRNTPGYSSIFAGEDAIPELSKRQEFERQGENINEELDIKVSQVKRELRELNKHLENQIKERNDIENELLNSQRLYNTLAANFPNGLIGVLNRELRYVLVGGKELERLNVTPEDLIGHKVFEIFPDFPRIYENKLRSAFGEETVSFDVEISGSLYSIVAAALPDIQSEMVSEILVVITNVVQGTKMKADLQSAITQEKELVELKSRFVTMASHEFRTPLGTILSSVFLLERYNDPRHGEKRTVHINRIKKTINNLTELLNNFLSLGKLDEGNIKVTPKQTNIVTTLQEILEELQALKKPDQEFEYIYHGVNRVVSLDTHLLHNIFINLISNAIKYSPANGIIKVISEINDHCFMLYVIDHGSGILEEDQQHIFKRFFRSKNVTNIEGTGMGLHIVKRYVELMKGTIQFTSNENGTTFKISIPII